MASDINNAKSYWNGKLAGKPNLLYNKFVNFDVVWPTYSHFWQRKKPTSFFLEKRKWYMNHVLTTRFEWWTVTDIVQLDESTCSGKKWYEFYYLINNANMKIIWAEIWDCDNFFTVYDGCRCECQYDRFITTDFVRWIPRKLADTWLSNNRVSTTWKQVNSTWALPLWYFTDSLNFNYDTNDNGIRNGDYVYVWWSPNTDWSAYCWQVRQVLNIWDFQWSDDDDDFRLSTPWSNFAPSQTTATNATYSIFPEWGKVFMFATCEGIKIYHARNNTYTQEWTQLVPSGTPYLTTVCDYTFWLNGTINCVTSIQEYNDRINVMFDNGYNMFGWLAFDKMAMSLDNYNLVWPDKIISTVFRNFLLSFGKDSIYTLVYDANTQSNRWYPLRTNMGIWSKYAFTEFDNSFFFVASDRRLYALSIKADWEKYVLDLQDMSDIMKWDLEMLQDNDEVFLYADWQKLSIFINGRNNQDNTNTTKTKILNFNRDYGVWTEHHSSVVISWIRHWYFIGKWLFTYCGDKDGWTTIYTPWYIDSWHYFDAYVDSYIWEHEENGTDINMFTQKQINWIKVILGRWIYTNNNTVLEIDQNNSWYKAKYSVSNVESIEWIRNNNAIIAWTKSSIEPSRCILDNIDDYTTINRECIDSFESIQDKEVLHCGCPTETKKFDDYNICLDDKAYALSETYTIMFPLALMNSDLFRVRIYSKWGDRMVFGGMLIELEQQPINKWNADSMDVVVNDWCCSIQYCK